MQNPCRFLRRRALIRRFPCKKAQNKKSRRRRLFFGSFLRGQPTPDKPKNDKERDFSIWRNIPVGTKKKRKDFCKPLLFYGFCDKIGMEKKGQG